MKKISKLIYIFILFFIFPLHLGAVEKGIYLDEIIVKDSFDFESIDKPGFNTIITRQDIERSSAKSLFQILEKESSISLRSDTGGEKFTIVDLRGMGETAGSNVLIVVDGYTLNAADMSGQGLSDLPLDMVESVEIIRGGGIVENGGGAVSGVIKIRTRSPLKDMAMLDLSIGSNGLVDKNLFLSHRDEVQSIIINVLDYDSTGYRENGFYDKKKLDFGYKNTKIDSFNFGFKGSFLRDDYGLPGGVSIEDLDKKDKRKDSSFLNDNGFTHKKRGIFFLEKDISLLGRLKVSRIYETKENKYIMGYSPLISKEDQESKISSISRDLKVSLEKDNEFLSYKLGFDWFFDDYVRDSRSEDLRKNGELESKDLYLSTILKNDNLKFNLGVRSSWTDSKFREDLFLSGNQRTGDKNNDSYTNNGVEAGVSYAFKALPVEVFTTFARSYRNPNIDELALSTGEIDAQVSYNYEAGIKYSHKNFLKAEISYFHLKTDDEIYYGQDPKGGKYNRNYEDTTIRRGIDSSLTVYPIPSLFIRGNLSLMNAEFEDTEKEIPLVSENKFSLFMEYEFLRNFVFSSEYSFYSEKRQGGDIHGKLRKIPSCSIVDASLNYKYKNSLLYIRINNIFDEYYAGSSYENLAYPMPGREINAGIKLEF